ncbi:MAG: decaprenyl-phosphate phosphoribosyltransferase [Streptosporangiaceae bacterium]|nr:decaprenyl-phosphate phosphoribosyltransferase [Streptosporangiaceae bacterium]
MTGADPAAVIAPPAAWLRWPVAVLRTARPHQWPKNLMVFAAPLSGASLGRDDGIGYGLAAAGVFVLASASVYSVNDVLDAKRDRLHPLKRRRPVAAGELPTTHALTVAAVWSVAALALALSIGSPGLAIVVGAYLAISLLYSAWLKHLPVVELGLVASGFVLRALGGAAATHVPPSVWFLLVCSLGAFLVAIAKRHLERTGLAAAALHRPSLRWYRPSLLRTAQRCVAVAVCATYLLWALDATTEWRASWHLASTLPLAAALVRFNRLTKRQDLAAVEDLLLRDPFMVGCELTWLLLFVIGL